MRMIENHVERCHCWHCGGYGKVSYIRDGDVEAWMECCHDCDGNGELLPRKDHTDDGDPCLLDTGKTRLRRYRTDGHRPRPDIWQNR